LEGTILISNRIIFITGTPCTGKTTIAEQLNKCLSEKFFSKLIKINDLALEHDLIDGEDLEKNYKIVNISKLNEKLNIIINDFFISKKNQLNFDDINSASSSTSNSCNHFHYSISDDKPKSHEDPNYLNNSKIAIVEGHLSHFCSIGEFVDKVIVLRLKPEILESRLQLRGYDNAKIHENLEAEALGVCSIEAYENYGNKVNEIDTTNLSIEDVLNIVKDILLNKKSYPVGTVDFINWILD
jgi:adenylate kinase